MRLVKAGLLSTVVMLGLAACGIIDDPGNGGGDGPTITSFVATPSSIQSGGSSTLSWDVSGATSLEIDQGVGDVTGLSSVTVNPTTTTQYTLTATNADGSTDASTTVTVGDGPIDPPVGAPSGTFGVSTSASGPFTNDLGDNISSPSDERIITVSPGSTFYAQVDYDSAQPITGIIINLVNRSPEGLQGTLNTTEAVGGFTLVGEPTGDCDLSGAATSVTCVYEISVGSDVVNIDQLEGSGNEFAYVFRTQVSDAAGNTSNEPIRGYVIVQ